MFYISYAYMNICALFCPAYSQKSDVSRASVRFLPLFLRTYNRHILSVLQHVLLAIRQLILYLDSHLDFQLDIKYLQWLISQVTDKLMAVFSCYSTLLSLL